MPELKSALDRESFKNDAIDRHLRGLLDNRRSAIDTVKLAAENLLESDQVVELLELASHAVREPGGHVWRRWLEINLKHRECSIGVALSTPERDGPTIFAIFVGAASEGQALNVGVCVHEGSNEIFKQSSQFNADEKLPTILSRLKALTKAAVPHMLRHAYAIPTEVG